MEVFEERRPEPRPNELQLYTWMDANLRELSKAISDWVADLIKEMVPAAKQKDAVLEYYAIYASSTGKFRKKQAGSVSAIGKGKDDLTSLETLKMRVGDCFGINIRTGSNPIFSTAH